LNEITFAQKWQNSVQMRKLEDKNLTRNALNETNQARQEHAQVEIDISIAESRIRDLENQKNMINQNIEELLTEKRKVDKENLELEYKI